MLFNGLHSLRVRTKATAYLVSVEKAQLPWLTPLPLPHNCGGTVRPCGALGEESPLSLLPSAGEFPPGTGQAGQAGKQTHLD